jgi:hypothetical protein
MAAVRLGRYEAKAGHLPKTCVCCGSRAVLARRRVFSWCPWWFYPLVPLGILPFLLVWAFFARRARVVAPVCAAHRFHWWWRSGVLLLAVILNFALALLTLRLAQDPADFFDDAPGLIAFLTGISVLMPTGLLALGLMFRWTGVHAAAIDEHSITLGGVADEFVEAVRVRHGDASGAVLEPTRNP